MKNIGFLFDLDGVLIDSEREYTRIWESIEERYPTGKENFALSIKGQTLTKILDDHYNEEEKLSVTKELHRLEKEMTYSYCMGAESFLNKINKAEGNTAVVTSSEGDKMEHLYNDIPDFRTKVKVVIDAGKVSKSKPDPEGYITAARELELDIRKCVVFEDSVQGVRAGRASGAYVVGITGTKTREDLQPFSDVVVDSFEEINLEQLTDLLRSR